mgnify:FL=1
MIKKLISTVVSAAICATALSADKLEISNDGLGDFLIAPMYVAKDNVCSKITVFNTNETSSILAKVTFRERISSQEVDLPIFLSPADVWEGEVCETRDGVVLKSNDDSNHPVVKDVLSRGKNLAEHSRNAGHEGIDFTKGYVEIYPIAQFNEGSTAKVEKYLLVDRWDSLIKGNTNNPKLRKNGVDSSSLSGHVTFNTESDLETAVLPMLAFKGAHDKQVTGVGIDYSSDTSPRVLLGAQKKKKILKALQHRITSFTYDQEGRNQYINFTFPFTYSKWQNRTYKITVRDMSENKDSKKEKVIIFSPAPKKQNIKNTMKNEVVSISVEEILAKTNNPKMFKNGIIQIKDITNQSNIQLGEDQRASYIAVNYKEVSVMEDRRLVENNAVGTIVYAPSK